MALHETPSRSNEWYTPDYVFRAMNVRFDLDVSAPENGCPADNWCGARITNHGLETHWRGFVWMNPPFGGRMALVPWLTRFQDHGHGVALVPDRTSCPWWQDYAPRASSMLAVAGKIRFIPGPGAKASSPAQGTTLLALGPQGDTALLNAARAGLGSLWRPG